MYLHVRSDEVPSQGAFGDLQAPALPRDRIVAADRALLHDAQRGREPLVLDHHEAALGQRRWMAKARVVVRQIAFPVLSTVNAVSSAPA